MKMKENLVKYLVADKIEPAEHVIHSCGMR